MKNEKKLGVILGLSFLFLGNVYSQETKFAAGLYTDAMMESPGYDTYYGGAFRYDFKNHQAIKGYIGTSTVSTTSIGAEYIYSFLDKTKSNFNIFLAAGPSIDFYRQNLVVEVEGEEYTTTLKKNWFLINPTIGLSYFIKPINTSLTAGYKLRYAPFEGGADINFLSVGLLYHW